MGNVSSRWVPHVIINSLLSPFLSDKIIKIIISTSSSTTFKPNFQFRPFFFSFPPPFPFFSEPYSLSLSLSLSPSFPFSLIFFAFFSSSRISFLAQWSLVVDAREEGPRLPWTVMAVSRNPSKVRIFCCFFIFMYMLK